MKHPLAIGTRVVTLRGDQDTGDNDEERFAAPGEVGVIIDSTDHGFHPGSQGWSYGVEFFPSRVWVFIDQHEIEDPAQYTLLPTIEDELEQLVTNYRGVMEDYDAGFPIERDDHPHNEDWKKVTAMLDWLAARRKAESDAREDLP